jgi:hypothetical protein
MQGNAIEHVEVEPLEELFGDVEETEAEALERLGENDFAETPHDRLGRVDSASPLLGAATER